MLSCVVTCVLNDALFRSVVSLKTETVKMITGTQDENRRTLPDCPSGTKRYANLRLRAVLKDNKPKGKLGSLSPPLAPCNNPVKFRYFGDRYH